MSLLDPLLDDAEAAILVEDAPIGFGYMGCQRTSELVGFLIRAKQTLYLRMIFLNMVTVAILLGYNTSFP
jgi:putative methanogenesis marker protein 5